MTAKRTAAVNFRDVVAPVALLMGVGWRLGYMGVGLDMVNKRVSM